MCTILTNSDSQQKLIDDPPSWYKPVDRRGTRAEIAVRRFRPTSSGYRLVQDVS